MPDANLVDAAIANMALSTDFRIVLRTWLADNGYLTGPFLCPNPHTTNALTTAHETGKMAAITGLLALVCAVKPDFTITLMQEALSDAE